MLRAGLNAVALVGDAWLVEKQTRPTAKGMDRTRSAAPSVPPDVATPTAVPPILELQRSCGNAAVTRTLLARCGDGGKGGGLAVLPGSPDARHAEDKQREQEAREEYERHLRETGERPKEHQMRRAADKQFAAQEDAEAAQAIGEALERIRQRERHARDVVAAHKLALEARQERWRQAWSQKEVEGSLKGLLKPALQSAEELRLRAKANDAQNAIRRLEGTSKGPKPPEAGAKPSKAVAEAQPADADATRLVAAKQRLQEATEALERKQGEFKAHRELQERRATALIDAVVNPNVSGHALSQAVNAFLGTTSASVNLTKKLSELVAAKAVWFSGSDPVELAPGPKAVDRADSPDYVSGENIIGDNFRVEGVAPARGEVALQPDPIAHARPMQNVLNAITKGIKSKVTTYFLTHVRHGKRVVVTVDVSDCPWVLQPAHLSAIASVARENAGVVAKEATAGTKMSVADCLNAVYFVVDGRAYRVFPGWRSPAGFDPSIQPVSADSSPSAAAPAVEPATRSKAAKVNVKGPSKESPLTLGEDLQKLVDRTTELLAGNKSALEELAHVLRLFAQRRMAPPREPVESGSRRVLGDVLTKLNTFLEKHGKRVRGDFVKRIWRSITTSGDMREAEGELEAATAILEGETPLGAVQSVEALPESTVPEVETPEFRVVLASGSTALVEVKTIGGVSQSAVKKNLNKAISQIRFQSDADAASAATPSEAPSSSNNDAPKPTAPTQGGAAGGMIRIDATGGKPSTLEPSEQADEIYRWIKGELTQLRGEVDRQRRATDFVRFVEVLFSSTQGTVTVIFECHGETVTRRSIGVAGAGGQSGAGPAPSPSGSGEKGLND
jgi:hypothetical protein